MTKEEKLEAMKKIKKVFNEILSIVRKVVEKIKAKIKPIAIAATNEDAKKHMMIYKRAKKKRIKRKHFKIFMNIVFES